MALRRRTVRNASAVAAQLRALSRSEPNSATFASARCCSDDDWAALPLAIRRRFSKRLAGGDTTVYVGEVIETRMSRAGWLLAQAARLIGGPLPRVARRACAERRHRHRGRRDAAASSGPASTRAAAAFRRSCIRRSASPARPGLRNMSATASAWR